MTDRPSAPQPVAGWQPIETAPKGRLLLVGYTNRAGKWRSVRGRYYFAETLESEISDSGWADEGWYEECDNAEEINFTEEPPTHWMPLPAPPGEQPPLYDQAALDAVRAEERRQWIAAIDGAMVCSHIGVFNDGDDPRAALNKVLAWHQMVALDPAVSSDARALQEQARAEERERCARIVEPPPGTEAWEVIGHEEGLTMLRELAAAIRAATPQEPI